MSHYIEVTVRALIASIILFVSGLVTLFQQDASLTFSQITQGAWVALSGGAILSALKDIQSLFADKPHRQRKSPPNDTEHTQ